jgi:putative transposase
MPHRIYKNILYHFVFITRYRSPVITMEMLAQLRVLFRRKADDLECVIHILNGYRDHVHALLSAPPKLSISDLVKHLKGFSSFSIGDLWWQKGYGVFTVDAYSFSRVFMYIRGQGEHRKR